MNSRKLIEIATNLAQPFKPSKDCSSGSVAAALLTVDGNVHAGVCIDCNCGVGFCAEHSAVAEMLKHRESRIRMIVAVNSAGVIRSPCGRCRELMWQVDPQNAEADIILDADRSARLSDLLPQR